MMDFSLWDKNGSQICSSQCQAIKPFTIRAVANSVVDQNANDAMA